MRLRPRQAPHHRVCSGLLFRPAHRRNEWHNWRHVRRIALRAIRMRYSQRKPPTASVRVVPLGSACALDACYVPPRSMYAEYAIELSAASPKCRKCRKDCDAWRIWGASDNNCHRVTRCVTMPPPATCTLSAQLHNTQAYTFAQLAIIAHVRTVHKMRQVRGLRGPGAPPGRAGCVIYITPLLRTYTVSIRCHRSGACCSTRTMRTYHRGIIADCAGGCVRATLARASPCGFCCVSKVFRPLWLVCMLTSGARCGIMRG